MTMTTAAHDDASDIRHGMDKCLSYPVDKRDNLEFWKDHDTPEKLAIMSNIARHV